jgi:hypothetical protein
MLVAFAAVCLSSWSAMAANKLIVKDSTGTTDKFVVTDSGYIGIGTNAPSTPIEVSGNTGASSRIVSHCTSSTSSYSGGFIARKNNASTKNNGLPVLNDRLGFMYYGSLGTSAELYAAGLSAYAESDWTDVSYPASFVFETTAAGSGRTEKMRVTGDGNVGIGTKAPTQKLHVNGGIRLYTSTAKPACSAATRGTLWFEQGTTDKLYICAQNGGVPVWRLVTLQ